MSAPEPGARSIVDDEIDRVAAPVDLRKAFDLFAPDVDSSGPGDFDEIESERKSAIELVESFQKNSPEIEEESELSAAVVGLLREIPPTTLQVLLFSFVRQVGANVKIGIDNGYDVRSLAPKDLVKGLGKRFAGNMLSIAPASAVIKYIG